MSLIGGDEGAAEVVVGVAAELVAVAAAAALRSSIANACASAMLALESNSSGVLSSPRTTCDAAPLSDSPAFV